MGRTTASNRVNDLGIAKALRLPGSNTGNVDFGAQTFLNGTPFTFGIRVSFDETSPSPTQDGTLWSYGYDATGDKGYLIRLNGASGNGTRRRLNTFWGASANTRIHTGVLCVGKKYIFVDFDGNTTGRVFVGTDLKDTFTMAARTASTGPGLTKTFIGTRDGTGRNLVATVGDGCIYNRRLTDAERAAIVNRASYVSSGLQLQPRCNENTGTNIVDYSGNSRNGTLGTGVWRNSPFNA